MSAGRRLIEGAEEALAIAKGEQPAAAIWHNGHQYVPATEIASLRRELEEVHRNALREAIAAIAGKIDEARSFGVEGRELTAMGWSLSAVQELLERWPPKPAAAIRNLAGEKADG